MANIEDLRDRSVSSGTLKSEDLIPKFLGVLKTYGKDKYDEYIKENPEVEDWENLDEETMGWVVDELTDLLNEIAPDGCYFGASEGDGADFGFWSMSNESKKNETNSPEEEAVKKVLMDASADAEFRREAGKDFSAEDFEKSIDANIEKLRDVFLDVLYFDDGSFKCDVNDHEETRELCSFVASKVAYILGLSDSVATAIDGYLLWYVVQENIVSDESKKSEAGGSVDAQTFPNITDTTLQILKQGGHRVLVKTLEDVVADLAYGEAAGSGIFDPSKKISVKDVLKQTINDFDNSPLNIGKGLMGQFAVNNKDRLREIYPIALKECDVELSPDFEDTYNSDDLYPFMKWVIVKVADALYDKVSESKKSEGRDLDEYLQEVWDSLESAWDKSKFDMKQGYDSEYECDCITITSKDNEGVLAKIYVNDYEGKHPVGFDVVYRYPGDKGVGVMGSYEFQSTDMDGLGEEVFDYFDEIKQKAAVASFESDLQAYADAVKADKYDKQSVVDDGWDFDNSVEYDEDIVRDNFKKKYDGKTYLLHITFNPSTKDVSDVKWDISAIESKKSEDAKVGRFTIMPKDTSRKQAGIRDYQTRLGEMGFKSNLHNNGDYTHDYVKEIGKIPGATVYVGTIDNFQKNTQEYQYEAELYMENEKGIRSNIEYMPFAITDISDGTQRKMYFNRLNALIRKGTDFVNNDESSESCKKSESLTLKQKELKDMARFGQAEDITTISDAEAKELKKKGIETVGISRGTYGMNGALLRDNEGNKYVITARSSNLFYFV